MEITLDLSPKTVNFSCLTIFLAMHNRLSCLPQKALARLHLSTQSHSGTQILRTTWYVIRKSLAAVYCFT